MTVVIHLDPQRGSALDANLAIPHSLATLPLHAGGPKSIQIESVSPNAISLMPTSRPTQNPTNAEKRLPVFQVLLLILAIGVLAALFADNIAKLPHEVSRVVQTLDLVACGLFFFDFCVRFARAESKAQFMKWAWIDLVACIPNIDFLRVGRFVRVLRIIRLLRNFRVSYRLLSAVFAGRPRNAFAAMGLTVFLLVVSSSMGILICETTPEANIKTAEDAVWWSVTTVTTVGYGDKYPTTSEGRILAMMLMVSGVGLFGTLSGVVASWFLSHGEGNHSELDQVLRELKELRAQLNEINRDR